MIDGELLGQIALANADHDYTERDLTLVERLASFYALAVQHQRTGEALYRNAQRLEQLTNHLELQVASRTAELRATNQRLVSELEERQRIEAALRASETRYRLLAENASDVIWTVDLQNNPTYVSPSVTRLLGFSVEEAMSMTAADIFSPASFEHALQAFQALVGAKISGADDAQDTYRADYDLVHKDGSLVPVEINFSFLYNERGFPTGVLAITRSISERRQAELKISRRNSELQALVMISQVSNQTLHLDELLHSTLQVVLQVLNFEAGGIYLVDPNGESLRLHTHQGISEEFLHSVQRLYIGNGSAGRAYAENRPVIMDINNYPTGQLTPAAREHAYRTTLSTPLTAGGKILGVLNLGSRQESPYLVEDIPYLEAIGRQLGQAIANAQLYELAQTEIHMRRQAEKAILDSEARYRLLAETSRDSIFVINRDDRVLYLNGTAAAQFNQSAEALVGKQRSTLFPPATRVQQDESLRLVFETGQVYSEEHRHQFGERQAWLSTTLAPLHIENGQVSAVMGVSRDITERMLAQEAINYQANLVACVTDAIIATDMKFVISAWNTAAERMYGWKVAEVLV
jgi:PAS domain S-box-containing protein